MSADAAAAPTLPSADLPARKSYMTKEQLETYLSDLRSNRTQRPTGARPLSSAAKHRWSSIRSSMSASVPPQAEIDEIVNNGPPTLVSATPAPEISRRESKLIRKHSIGRHKRANTISSMVSLGSVRGRHSEEAWDGVDKHGIRSSDAVPPASGGAGVGAGRTASMTSKRRSLRGLASLVSSSSSSNTNQQSRPQSATQSVYSQSSSSSGNSDGKKKVSWDTSRPTSPPPPIMMPPCHPPKAEDSDKIEKELTLHFENMSTTQALPAVAPLRINKTGGNVLGGVPGSRPADGTTSKQTTETKDPKPPAAPERTATYPGRKEYGTPYPPRKEYVEPWRREPTQHNKVQYTTNSTAPLPSPPGSASEGEDVEADILREMGRRPLPRGPTPPEQPTRKNNTKYGAQVPPPAAPVIGIVTSPSPPPVSRTQTAPPTIPTISLPDDDMPTINVTSASSNPPVPSINISSSSTPSVPTISLPGSDAPSISVSVAGPSSSNPRPLPRPGPRPRPSPSVASDSSTRSARGPTATCNHCRNPIQGRIVSAASLRFHPSCFRCAHCSTSLEHVGFFPEPSEARRSRLEAAPETTDTDAGVRFYCHLDFHELFSPRCKSCKTPIEGEVVVACGSTWHPGHFFCAECGDPFEKTSRFVEKEGYAWCVCCYTKRFSGKCRKCRRPVTETVVKALGGEWHEDCFCCTECDSVFKDGRFFVRNEGGKEVPVCVQCEERRLKQ